MYTPKVTVGNITLIKVNEDKKELKIKTSNHVK